LEEDEDAGFKIPPQCPYLKTGAELLSVSSNIFVGGTSALVPHRTKDLSRIGPRALAAATLACLTTATVAGTFYTGSSVLFGK